MPPAALWILVALAAILVGAVVLVLLQLRHTLRVAEATFESTGRRLDEALTQLTVTLERVNRASAELETGVKRVSSLLDALGGVGDMLGKVRGSLGTMATIGASLGSVFVGAVRAAFGGRDRPAPAESGSDEPIESEEMNR